MASIQTCESSENEGVDASAVEMVETGITFKVYREEIIPLSDKCVGHLDARRRIQGEAGDSDDADLIFLLHLVHLHKVPVG